jgi:type IV pilus assembly protein PilA
MKNTKLQNPSLRKRKGFTLIELIVVIAILAILAAIAVPTFIGTLDKAKMSTHNANVMSLRSAAAVALADAGGAPTNNVTWSATYDATAKTFTITSKLGNTDTTAAGKFHAPNYIDQWPTQPFASTPGSNIYSVVIAQTTGAITVTPAKDTKVTT